MIMVLLFKIPQNIQYLNYLTLCIRKLSEYAPGIRLSPIISLYAESGEPSLWTRRKQLALQFYCHVQTLTNSPTYRCLQQQVLNQPIPGSFMSFINNSCEALNMPAIHVVAATQYPHWQATSPPICLNYIKDRKSDCNSDSLRTMFLPQQYENDRDCVHLSM